MVATSRSVRSTVQCSLFTAHGTLWCHKGHLGVAYDGMEGLANRNRRSLLVCSSDFRHSWSEGTAFILHFCELSLGGHCIQKSYSLVVAVWALLGVDPATGLVALPFCAYSEAPGVAHGDVLCVMSLVVSAASRSGVLLLRWRLSAF